MFIYLSFYHLRRFKLFANISLLKKKNFSYVVSFNSVLKRLAFYFVHMSYFYLY